MMNKHSPFTQTFDQLPDTLPVFPLNNAVVLPGGYLPLNIFEPRYLNMVQDAMESHRLVGMVQPRDESGNPELYRIGCAGRITRYQETLDGRLEIMLSGLCRFRIADELSTTRGYRLVKPGWSDFNIDFDSPQEADTIEQTQFKTALRSYLEEVEMQADWDNLEKVSQEELINSLVSVLPLNADDKQLLIEADTLTQRLRAFTAVLEGYSKASVARH